MLMGVEDNDMSWWVRAQEPLQTSHAEIKVNRGCRGEQEWGEGQTLSLGQQCRQVVGSKGRQTGAS
jgi:hypothetical protein